MMQHTSANSPKPVNKPVCAYGPQNSARAADVNTKWWNAPGS